MVTSFPMSWFPIACVWVCVWEGEHWGRERERERARNGGGWVREMRQYVMVKDHIHCYRSQYQCNRYYKLYCITLFICASSLWLALEKQWAGFWQNFMFDSLRSISRDFKSVIFGHFLKGFHDFWQDRNGWVSNRPLIRKGYNALKKTSDKPDFICENIFFFSQKSFFTECNRQNWANLVPNSSSWFAIRRME